MKKKCFLIIILLFILLFLLSFYKIRFWDKTLNEGDKLNSKEDTYKEENEEEKIESFNLSEFQQEIENFSFKKKYENVESEKQAVDLAFKIWEQEYDSEYADEPYKLEDLEQIIVKYDVENDCWYITGSWQISFSKDRPYVIGGEPSLLIKSNGETIAMWINN